MPRRYAMSTLVSRCQQRCDMETSGLITTAEWKSLVSEQYGDLYSVVADSGYRYFEYLATLTTTGAAYVAEPTDHLATIAVLYVVDASGHRRRLRALSPQERPRWGGRTGTAWFYEFVDDRIYLYPVPPSGQSYELLYIPQPPDLTSYADSDIVDVVAPDGESFLIWGVAVKALAKQGSDVQLAMAEREQARTRLTEWAALREFSEPRRPFLDYEDDVCVDDASWWYR